MPDSQPEQGTHFWFMTVQYLTPGGGFSLRTIYGDTTPAPDDTRNSIFVRILGRFEPGGNVIAFDIQPNQL